MSAPVVTEAGEDDECEVAGGRASVDGVECGICVGGGVSEGRWDVGRERKRDEGEEVTGKQIRFKGDGRNAAWRPPTGDVVSMWSWIGFTLKFKLYLKETEEEEEEE